MATEKKQSFLGGAAVLAFGIVAVKIIGAVFKIPLRNILGEGGSADFSNAYNIYATLLTVSTAGLPVALSKLVSESYALGRTRQAHRTFRVSLSVFLVLGVASFALMWWGSDLLAGFLNNPRAAYGIRALAPAVVCVGCLSAFRGYAQGRQYMTPTAVSQIIEALCKLMLGLALSMWLLHIGQPDYIAAAGAIAGARLHGDRLPAPPPRAAPRRALRVGRRDPPPPFGPRRPHHPLVLDGLPHHPHRHQARPGQTAGRPRLHARPDARRLRQLLRLHGPL